MKNSSLQFGFLFFLIGFTISSCKETGSGATGSVPGVCSTPPLGWNSYDSYGVYLNQNDARALLDVMADKYLSSGYDYFVIDAGWYEEAEMAPGTKYPSKNLGPSLDQFGVYEPSHTYFPQGLKVLADKAHGLGLKFGLHLMRGIPRKAVRMNLPVKGTSFHAKDIADTMNVCVWSSLTYGVDMSKAGAQDWYNSIFEKFASWGIDFVKVDDMTPYPLEIDAIKKAIIHCGRPMTYSLSPGDVNNFLHLPYYREANMVRITGDIWDRGSDIAKVFKSWKSFQGVGSKGFWPDMDMIPFGQLNILIPKEFADNHDPEKKNFSHLCRLSKDQMQTFITMRALAASPLFIGGDLLTMDDYSYSLLTDKNMLACDQNGVMGTNVLDRDSVEIWHTCNAGQFGKGWIGIFNRSVHDKDQTFSKRELGLLKYFKSYQSVELEGSIQAYDIWNKSNIELKDSCAMHIPANGVVFLEYNLDGNK